MDSSEEREVNQDEDRDVVDNTMLSGNSYANSPGKLSRESSEARDYGNFDRSVNYGG